MKMLSSGFWGKKDNQKLWFYLNSYGHFSNASLNIVRKGKQHMKKIANILLLISGIFGIIAAVVVGIIAIVSMTGVGAAAAAEGGMSGGEAAAAGIITGVVLLILLIPILVDVILCFRARKVQTQGSYIAVLVFGILGGNLFAIIGGVLGLVNE
jgi:hypothetical protein